MTEDLLAAYEEFGWDDAARLVDADGKITDIRSMGFSERDRLELVKCLATPEGMRRAGRAPGTWSRLR